MLTTDFDISGGVGSIIEEPAIPISPLTVALMDQNAMQPQDMLCFDFFLTGAQTTADKNSCFVFSH